MQKYTSNIEPPLVASRAEDINWDDEADLVVVGFGGAGVVAALQARECNASVIVLDRFQGGGATEKSGGVIYAGGTKFQAQAGFDDTAEEMYKYLSYEGTPVRDETLKRFCETSNENIEWLGRYGVQFGSNLYSERTGYPPNGYFLYYTGMEKFRGDVARVAPRGHRTVGKGTTGQYYFQPLKEAALRNGVQFIQHSPARRLIVDENGTVLGVEVQAIPEEHWKDHMELYNKVDCKRPFNGPVAEDAIEKCANLETSIPQIRRRLRARKGVILAAGGYNYNLKLFSKFRPEIMDAYPVIIRGGSMGCDGSGIELGLSAGGAIARMDHVFMGKSISPPKELIKGIAVNTEGQRFINEDAYLGNFGYACSQQSHGGAAWLIVDRKIFWRAMFQLLNPQSILQMWGMTTMLNILFGGTKKDKTIAELARKCGIDGAALEHTLSRYNEMAGKNQDTALGKNSAYLSPIRSPSYRAINLSLNNKYGFVATMPYGGLTVDEDSGAVTREDGSVIRGLYAAGRSAVGICSKSNFSGLSIADTVFSGRRAARSALS